MKKSSIKFKLNLENLDIIKAASSGLLIQAQDALYSMVPNNRAARLFIFSEFVPPTRLIWHYITVHKNTYTLINFKSFWQIHQF